MAEVKKIATRESYGNALVELGAENPNVVVLDADLAAATKTGMFKKAYPDRHIDCGIAECNMMWQQDLLRPVKFLLSAALQCLQQEEPLSRFATP